MGRYTEARCRLCRREGTKLFLKGARCGTQKCAFTKRPNTPGMHLRQRGKASYYAIQLREKQKSKRIYGMWERQFRRFFDLATKAKGVTGRKLIELLERRIDNVIYRSLLAHSRSQARQFVGHGLVFVNGKRINIPSYLVKADEVIELKCKDPLMSNIKSSIDNVAKERSVPGWIAVDNSVLKINVSRLPVKEDLTIPINEQLIIELYSK